MGKDLKALILLSEPPEPFTRTWQLLRLFQALPGVTAEVICYLGGMDVTPFSVTMVKRGPSALLRACREKLEHHAGDALIWIGDEEAGKALESVKKLGLPVLLEVPTGLFLKKFGKRNLWQTLFADPLERYRRKESVLKLAEGANLLVCANEKEASQLRHWRSNLHVVARSIAPADYERVRVRCLEDPPLLFYPGPFDTVTGEQGLEWFLLEVLPRMVRQSAQGKRPQFQVALVGRPPKDPRVLKLLKRALSQHGNLLHRREDPSHEMLRRSCLGLFPSFCDAHTHDRILETLASERAIVTTGHALQGLILAPTFDCFVAENADAFAGAISRLLKDPELRDRVALNGRQSLLRAYDAEKVSAQLTAALRLGLESRSGASARNR